MLNKSVFFEVSDVYNLPLSNRAANILRISVLAQKEQVVEEEFSKIDKYW